MNPETLPLILTIPELAQLLRISRASAYRLAASGQMPGVARLGKTLRAHRDAVLRWLEQGSVSAGKAKRR